MSFLIDLKKTAVFASQKAASSDVHEDGRFVGVLHLFDTKDGSVHLIVNPGQVGDSGSLTHSSEFVVYGTVAKAYPSLVSAEIWYGDAAQMSADGGAAYNGRVTGVRNSSLRLFVELGGSWKGIGLVDLRFGQSSDEDEITIPGCLKYLTGRQLRNIELFVGITNVSVAGNHLVIKHGDECLDS